MTRLVGQLIVDGLASGAIYAALAMAMVLIYRATRIVNFGQGEMATFTAFSAWQLTAWGWPLYVVLPVVAVLAFLLGAAVFQLVIRPIVAAPIETIVVATLGIFIVFQALSLWFWGSDQREFFKLFPDHGWDIASIRLSAFNVGVVVSVAAIALLIAALFKLTRIGLAMRAVASEREKSPDVGIRVERILLLGWGLAGVIGFLAAVLVAPKIFLSPSMMTPVLIYSLAAATIGGWDSPVGAIVSGLLVGVVESLGSTFVPIIGSELRLAIPVVLLLLVLLVRPAGLLGRTQMVRA